MDRYYLNDTRGYYLYLWGFILKITALFLDLVSNYKMDRTKKILIQKAKTEYYRGFLWLDIEESELRDFINTIKNTKSKKELDKITFNLFHC